jgi:hypothetical protein
MSEKKTTSKPAPKKVAIARRISPKTALGAKGQPGDRMPIESAELLDRVLREVRASKARRGPTGPAAILECAGSLTEEEAAVFEEALRWVRGEDEPEDPCTSSTPPH